MLRRPIFSLTVLLLTLPFLPPDPLGAQPVNDECGQPLVVGSLPYMHNQNDSVGTTDDTPDCYVALDTWYYFLAPSTGTVIIYSVGSFSVYEVAGGSPGLCPSTTDRIECEITDSTLEVEAGHAYYFQVGVSLSLSYGFQLRWYPDSCTTPLEVPALPFSNFMLFEYASPDGPLDCSMPRDLWYYYEPATDGQVRAESGYLISVYEVPVGSSGICPTSTQRIHCHEDEFVFSVSAGFAYLIQAGGGDSTATNLHLEPFGGAPNETCASPLPIAPDQFAHADFHLAIDSEPGTPCSMPHDLWYEFTAPYDVVVRMCTGANGSDTRLAVYDSGGACPVADDLLFCSVGSEAFPEYSLEALQGQSYLIQIGAGSPSDAPSDGVSFTFDLPDGSHTLEVPDQVVPADSEFTTSVLLNWGPVVNGPARPVTSWAYGVCIDSNRIELLTISAGATTATVNGGAPPGGYFDDIFVGEGFTSGCVVDFFGINVLPPGQGYELNTVECRAVPSVDPVVTTSFVFCDTLGFPRTPLSVAFRNVSSVPATPEGVISIVFGLPIFRRGDCNLDGRIDVADPVSVISYLFPDGAPVARAASSPAMSTATSSSTLQTRSAF